MAEIALKRGGMCSPRSRLMRPDVSDVQQLTFDDRINWFPHISSDSSLVASFSFRPACRGKPDGSEVRNVDPFNGGQGTINVAPWSPDSQAFAYVRYPAVVV